MNRDIYKDLLLWKEDAHRKPLLMRGARQIGKTYSVREFGQKDFKIFIELNFERNPEYKDIFKSNAPEEIIEKISLYTGKKLIPNDSLLFLDEIQECPAAILSLRYFYEEMPQLHIIGAGSLIEFCLKSENFRLPVGRIQYLFMYPLSFGEFLDALGENYLRSYLLNYANLSKIPESLHQKLNELVRKYFLLGGMPAVVKEYSQSHDVLKCITIQRSILDTYIDDFAKYSTIIRHRYLRKIIDTVPTMIGQKIVYANIDHEMRSGDLKEAFDLLELAGVMYAAYSTKASGLPLAAGVNEKFFKAVFLDIGLMLSVNDLHRESAIENDLTSIFKGSVAEQFVGQELIAYQSRMSKARIYYWFREQRNSQAELDYLIQVGSKIIPIEVKSGSTGRLRSMGVFLESHQIKKGYKISQAPHQEGDPIISVPFYGIESWLKNFNDNF